MKKYYEVDEVFKQYECEFSEEEEKLKKIMIEKPNFDKRVKKQKKNNSNMVYRKKHFIILENKKNQFIVVNKKKKFKEGHTHTNNFNYAKSLIDLCIRKRPPKRPQKRLLESLERLTDDKDYLKILENLKIKKGQKKNANTDDKS